jgi:hypothetical protein
MPRKQPHLAAVSGWLCAVCMQLSAASAHAQHFHLGLWQLSLAQAETSNSDADARHTTIARALFDEGLRFVDAEHWADARDRFARVLTLRYSAVAAYNLALAEARLGRGVVAAATLRKLLSDSTLDPKVHDRATALLTEVEARFGWLTLRVVGDCKGCTIYLDREEWPWAAVGVSVPIDPGSYALRLRIDDKVVDEQRLDVAPAAKVETSLMAPGAAKLAVGGAPDGMAGDPTSGPVQSSTDQGAHFNPLTSGWFWGAMGVIVAGAAAGIILATH